MRIALGEMSSVMRWMLEGMGRLDLSSKRTLESVWGVRLPGSMVEVSCGCWPTKRQARDGDSRRQAQRWMGCLRMVIFGLGKQDSENLVRNDTACDVEAGRSAMWARTLGASLQTVAWGKVCLYSSIL